MLVFQLSGILSLSETLPPVALKLDSRFISEHHIIKNFLLLHSFAALVQSLHPVSIPNCLAVLVLLFIFCSMVLFYDATLLTIHFADSEIHTTLSILLPFWSSIVGKCVQSNATYEFVESLAQFSRLNRLVLSCAGSDGHLSGTERNKHRKQVRSE